MSMEMLHIQFKDGSNPYVFYGHGDTAKEKQNSFHSEIHKWEKNYDLYILAYDDGDLFLEAEEKNKETADE